jgi:hypothetical protein
MHHITQPIKPCVLCVFVMKNIIHYENILQLAKDLN